MSQQITTIQEEASPFITNATRIVIKDEKDVGVASETLSRLNIFNDRLKEDREKITAPLNEALREVRLKYKPLESSVGEAIDIIRGKLSIYQQQALKAQSEATEALKRGDISLEDAVSLVPTNKATVQSGSVTFKPTQMLKIIDSKKIPRKYLVADNDAILDALKEGKKVAGCEIEIIQTVVNRRK